MGWNPKNIITCIEFGSAKIAALHGSFDKGGNPEVIGFAALPSDNSICKGEIVDRAKAAAILKKVLELADESAGTLINRKKCFCCISGPSFSSLQGEGNVMIYNDDHQVKREHIREAVEKAEKVPVPPDRIKVNCLDSFFVLDSRTRVADPLGYSATRLDAALHIITADRNRIQSFRTLLQEAGFEHEVHCVFSCVGAGFAALRKEEKEKGVLLLDMGTNLTEYMLVHREGVLASGVIPVGMDHLANDLSVGLELGIENCRKFLQKNMLGEAAGSYVEFPGANGNKGRSIPVTSFERIIHARLSELFTLIRMELAPGNLLSFAECGCVLTGGGALFSPCREILRDTLQIPVRIGNVSGIAGAMSGLEPLPRFSALLGVFKFAVEQEGYRENNGGLGKVGDALEDFGDRIVQRVKDVTKVFKI